MMTTYSGRQADIGTTWYKCSSLDIGEQLSSYPFVWCCALAMNVLIVMTLRSSFARRRSSKIKRNATVAFF